MSISSTANRVAYTGNGVTTALAFPYEFFATTDLVVLETVIATGVVTTKTLVTDYTVSGTPDASGIYPNGGTVTALVAPASTVKWTIYRDVPATQTTVFVDNNKLSAASLNNALDKLTLLAQRTREIVLRCVRLADGDVSGADTTLPTPVASKLLGWAADGLSVVNYAIADISSGVVTAFSGTLLALSTAAAWRTALGVGQGPSLIQTQTVSGVSSVNFTAGIDSTYDEYVIAISNLVPVTDATSLLMRVSEDAGASYKAGAADYKWAIFVTSDAATNGSAGSTGDTRISLATGFSNNASKAGAGRVSLFNPSSASVLKNVDANFNAIGSGGNFAKQMGGGVYVTNTSAITAIQFFFSSGNIATGTFSLYGTRK